MAIHPRSATSANGHGNANGTRLDKLLAYHEHAAAAIRLTIGLLNGHDKAAKTNGHATVIAQAVALDAARTTKTKSKTPRRANGEGAAAKRAQRARTFEVLAEFHPRQPRSAASVAEARHTTLPKLAIGPLLARGYLRKKGDGYVRTRKPYIVGPETAAPA